MNRCAFVVSVFLFVEPRRVFWKRVNRFWSTDTIKRLCNVNKNDGHLMFKRLSYYYLDMFRIRFKENDYLSFWGGPIGGCVDGPMCASAMNAMHNSFKCFFVVFVSECACIYTTLAFYNSFPLDWVTAEWLCCPNTLLFRVLRHNDIRYARVCQVFSIRSVSINFSFSYVSWIFGQNVYKWRAYWKSEPPLFDSSSPLAQTKD